MEDDSQLHILQAISRIMSSRENRESLLAAEDDKVASVLNGMMKGVERRSG